ncbi:MAG TPA: hypothetical protein PLG31_03890 [Spirochaetota bacterium]|nr:hypothetical protein [Spirochaetota bacterium]
MKRWLPFLLMFVIGAAACSEKFKEALEEERKATENLSLTLAVNSASIKLGDMTARFTATANYKEKGSQDVTGSCVFKIDNPAIIEIGQSGQVYPKSEGSTNVSFSYDNETSNTVSFTVADSTGPVIIVAQTQDLDHDGVLDAVKVFFSEPVKDSSVNVSAWSIAGVTGLHFDPTTDGDAPDDMIIYLTFTPNDLFTTEKQLSIAVSNNAVTDLGVNAIVPATANTIDGAPPVLKFNQGGMDHLGNGTKTLTLYFSEPVYGTRTNPACPDASISAGTFAYTDANPGGATEIANATNRCGTNVVELEMDNAFIATDTGDSISSKPGTLYDQAGNEIVAFASPISFNSQRGFFAFPHIGVSCGITIPLTIAPYIGKSLVVVAEGYGTTYIYDSATGGYSTGPPLSGTDGAYEGCNAFRIDSGNRTGQWLIIHGDYTNKTSYFNPADLSMNIGPELSKTVRHGNHVMKINSGMYAGKYIIIHAYQNNTTDIFDPLASSEDQRILPGPSFPYPSIAHYGCHSFVPMSGPYANKRIILRGDTKKVSVYDEENGAFIEGDAALQPKGNISHYSHTFYIESGVNAGKWLTVHGGSSIATSLFDESTGTYSNGPYLKGTVGNYGVTSMKIQSGPNAGRWLTMHNGKTCSSMYNPVTGSFDVGPVLPNESTDLNSVLFSFHTSRIQTGLHAGKWIVYNQGPSGQPGANLIYDEVANSFFLQRGAGSISAGTHSFMVPRGVFAGKWMCIRETSNSRIFDPTSGGFYEGPSLTTIGAGTHSFDITSGPNAGKRLVIHGNVSGQTASPISFYNYDTSSFESAGLMNRMVYYGAHSFKIKTGPYAGRWLIIHGSWTNTTSYCIESDSVDGDFKFVDGPQLTSAFGGYCVGQTLFLESGTYRGKWLTIIANSNKETSLYDEQTNQFTRVNDLLLTANAGPGTLSFRINSGINAGKWVIVHGTSSTILDETTSKTSIGPTLAPGTATTYGSYAVYLNTGVYNGRYMVMLGSDKTNLFNPDTMTFCEGPSSKNLGCYHGAHAFQITTGPRTGWFVMLSGPSTSASMNYFVP